MSVTLVSREVRCLDSIVRCKVVLLAVVQDRRAGVHGVPVRYVFAESRIFVFVVLYVLRLTLVEVVSRD